MDIGLKTRSSLVSLEAAKCNKKPRNRFLALQILPSGDLVLFYVVVIVVPSIIFNKVYVKSVSAFVRLQGMCLHHIDPSVLYRK